MSSDDPLGRSSVNLISSLVKKNKISPTSTDGVEQKWRRSHGFQFLLHVQQITGWLLWIFITGFTHFVSIPSLVNGNHQIALHVVMALLSSFLFCSMLTTSLYDCKDPGIVDEVRSIKCHWCNVFVSDSRTKHCSVCNKCVKGFDHHCKWLNHCIGARNYKCFIASISSACLLSTAVSLLCIMEICLFYLRCAIDPRFLNYPLNRNVFTVTTGIVLLLSSIAASLLIHLCAFHVYICWKGLTTYEYIKLQLARDAVGDEPPNYFANSKIPAIKLKKNFWTHFPCFFCYNTPKTEGNKHQESTSQESEQPVISSLLLQHTLNNMHVKSSLLPGLAISFDKPSVHTIAMHDKKQIDDNNYLGSA